MSAEGSAEGTCVQSVIERGALLMRSGSDVMNELMLCRHDMKMNAN